MRAAFAQFTRSEPPARSAEMRRWWACARAMIVLFVGIGWGLCPLQADAQLMRLRIAWGGGGEQQWQGTVAVEGGRITDKIALGVEADEPGSMWIDNGRLLIEQRSPRRYDGVDIAVHADRDATLTIVMASRAAASDPQTFEIPLQQLLDDQYGTKLDDQQNRLLVRRAPGDKLRVSIQNTSLVLAPGEQLRLQLAPHLADSEQTAIRIRAKVVAAAGGDLLWEDRQQVQVEGGMAHPVDYSIPVPDVEGVYNLEFTAIVPSNRRKFTPGNPFRDRDEVAADRTVQFVVIDPNRKTSDQADTVQPPSRVIDEIDPQEPWWKRVTRLPKLPALGTGPLQHGKVETWQHPQLGAMIRIERGTAGPNGSWTAYPLQVSHPGQPHILEVQYPSNLPQSMGISLLEPNASGNVLPVGLDAGIHVPDQAVLEKPGIGRHRIVFWPKTRQPVVLITNQRDDVVAVHGKIRLLGPKAVAVAGLNLAGDATTQLPTAMPQGILDEGRLLAAFMQRPLFPENFSAQEAFDPWSQRSMDDWNTFYAGATRLIEYLKYAGYNSLVISVADSGSSIFPSRLLEPTPRYDTGIFFASGQDPQRKDVLELLFRLCDREGIRLIPALEFASPLPALEDLMRQGGPASVGIEAIGPDGVAWSDLKSRPEGPSACYNPLHPKVQQVMIGVVRELLERYRDHPSFDGLVIGTSGHSFATFPGPKWPADPLTLQQFAQDTNSAGAGRNAAESQTQLWLDWRAFRLRQFHQRLADEVQQVDADAKLYLSLAPLLNRPEIQAMMRPALPPRARAFDALLGIGIKPQLYANNGGPQKIVLLNPGLVTPEHPGSGRAKLVSAALGTNLTSEVLMAGAVGFLQTTDPVPTHLASFDEKSPFGADKTHAVISSHLTPAGPATRRRLIRALVEQDAIHVLTGGDLLPLGQEETMRDIVIAYRRLPLGSFRTVPGETQPVVLRQLTRGEHTYLYLVNDSPWPCRCVAQLVAPSAVAVEELSGLRRVTQPNQENIWSVELNSYDLVAVRFDAANVAFDEPRVELPERVENHLRHRLDQLVARAASLDEVRSVQVLHNPGFEKIASGGEIPGWQTIGDPTAKVQLDSDQRHEGQAALRFRGHGAMASLVSQPFASPTTGRIAFSVWLKADEQFQGPLRLAISGLHDGKDFYRHGIAHPTTEWKQFEFAATDLPLVDLRKLRIRFDLMGAGQVWIDQVAVSNLRFSDNERTELSRILTHAHFALEKGQFSDCLRLLDGYWPDFLQRHVAVPVESHARDRRDERHAQGSDATETSPSSEQAETEDPWWKPRLRFWR